MNKALDDLAARKSLLLARSSMHRLQLTHEMQVLRESLTPRRIASAIPLRAVALGLLAFIASRTRFASIAGWAARALMVLRVVRSVRGMVARGRHA
jgi:hypothetical protein